MTGYVHIYTGDGKGKTTAALGLAVRACGAGLRVYFAQFLKGRPASELISLKERLPEMRVERFGRAEFVIGKTTPEDVAAAREGFESLRAAAASGKYEVVIADELNVAVALGLIPVDEVIRLIREKPAAVELVLTGRGADPRLLDCADLVTDMHKVKHYFDRGVAARPGIEL